MTDMRTDFETSLIEHLDFAPPCEVSNFWSEWVPCERAADWVVTYKRHCGGTLRTRLICEAHLADYMNPSHLSICETCIASTDVGPRIIRTERIGA